jgi:molybdopterin-guanine dinucleotide biosynthesis protein A
VAFNESRQDACAPSDSKKYTASMDSIAGFILVGGESRRMGTDKSALTLNGQSFVDRIAGEMSGVSSSVTIVGSNAAALQLNHSRKAAIVPDVYPHWGALGGVHAALAACSARRSAQSSPVWALVVACDFPFVTKELFIRLASVREGFEAVAPIQNDSIPQPLCALYRVEPCLTRAEELIKSGERKPIALLQSVGTRWILFSELADLKQANSLFDNINTPQDYARIAPERS